MKAARLHNYHEALKVEEIDEPKILGPHDVIVKIGAAGLCRTDLHIQEGQWAEKSGVVLPYVPGHENAGWVHEIGSDVSQRRGRRHRDRPPVHLVRAVPAVPQGRRHALHQRRVPGHRARRRVRGVPAHVSARSVVKLDPSLHPTDIAALADAGLTAIHAVKKAIPMLGRGHEDRRDRRRRARATSASSA